ncbi:MAG: DUF6134 family protein [Povalibacter sp.]
MSVFNFVAYQLVWFASVLGAARGHPWLGPVTASCFLLAHLALIRFVRHEIRLIILSMAIGFVVDSVLVRTGQIVFAASNWPHGWQPYWMLSLWAAFAATLNHSMRWIASRPWIAAALGAIGGPFAYAAAAKCGALAISSGEVALPAIGVAWSLSLYVLSVAARRFTSETVAARLRIASGTILPAVLLFAIAVLAWPAKSFAREWKFDVLLDGKHIGEHRFELQEKGTQRDLISEANFDVRILFFSAYRYRHSARERWNGDCVERLDAQTNDNGMKLAVTAVRNADAFEVTSGDTVHQFSAPEGCVQTFAYWNPLILEADRLLNSQTGEYQSVRVQAVGRERLDGAVVDRYRLTSTDEVLQIDLWYTPSLDWIALESRMPRGHQLRYVRRRDPAQ